MQGIDSLWINWALSVGSLAGVIFLALFISKIWLPAIAIGFAFILMARMSGRDTRKGVCDILPYAAVRILLISAAIMVFINLYYMKFINPDEYINGRANRSIPYVTVLIVSPVTNVVMLWVYLMRRRLSICARCGLDTGSPLERGFLGVVTSSEIRTQLRLVFFVSVIITMYTWVYYATTYSNVNLNITDRYYYVVAPAVLYVLSLIYFAGRCFKIYMFYRENVVGGASAELTTILRYIIICDGCVFLKNAKVEKSDELKCDTPAIVRIPYRERITPYDAALNFKTVSGISQNVEIKFLYENANNYADSNIFHYLCVVKSRSELSDSRLTGEWYTQSQLERMHASGDLSSLLMSEIHRVYTIMMARKTYDRSGHRLYDIKHYKPTFRLDELETVEKDFSDPMWLIVARDNEDRPFFRLRQFWRKHVKHSQY